MPIGADVSAQYTEEAVGGGHPTKSRVIDRLALVEHHVDGRHNAAKFPIGCGGYFKYNSAIECQLGKSASPGNLWGDAIPFNPVSGDPYFLNLGAAKTISNAGLAANTTYYAYARDNAGAVALELSTTAPDLSTSLIPTKTGDATRTLVGAVRTDASTPGQFVDSETTRFVRTWFNGTRIRARNKFTGSKITASTTYVELSSTEGRLNLLLLPGEVVRVSISGGYQNINSASDGLITAMGADVTNAAYYSAHRNLPNAANIDKGFALSDVYVPGPAINNIFLTIIGKTAVGNTGTWGADTTIIADIG